MVRSNSIYSVNHGLAPYLKTLRHTILEKSDTFSFDESFKEVTQISEIYLFVTSVRYHGSMLFGHGRHTEMLNHFVQMAKDLKSECLLQISMDGLTVKMKFLGGALTSICHFFRPAVHPSVHPLHSISQESYII